MQDRHADTNLTGQVSQLLDQARDVLDTLPPGLVLNLQTTVLIPVGRVVIGWTWTVSRIPLPGGGDA